MIKNIIFDLDGTLADTAIATTKAFREFAPIYNLPELSIDVIKSAIGFADPQFYYILYPDINKSVLKEFAKNVEDYENQATYELGDNILFPDVKTMLNKLHSQGHKLFIASTGSPSHVDCVLESACIRDLFELICCGESEKIEMVKNIIGDSSKVNWTMVGDKKKDADAAKFNNIISVGAAYGYCLPQDFDKFTKIINSPLELIK